MEDSIPFNCNGSLFVALNKKRRLHSVVYMSYFTVTNIRNINTEKIIYNFRIYSSIFPQVYS